MICKNKFCIFNKDNNYLYSSIKINEYGLCSSIIHINFDDTEFKELKSKMYGDIQKYWTDDKSDR